ncbi:MAG: TonB-dependent receptor plug domain-containing protein [Prevotella sp.]
MKRTTLIYIIATAMPIAASAQIHQKRDTAKVAKEMSLNPVVVTGSGHHQRLATAITPVHVISAKEIEEQGITTFADALIRTMPQLSMAPNSMGSQLRLNGLGGKYILVLVNGRKLSGEMSNNADLQRINMARVKRIEILDGAASSLYGSDAIAGVINVITDQPTSDLVSVTSDTRVSGEGVLTESVNLDIFSHGFGSYTSFSHDQADSYRVNDYEYVSGEEGATQRSLSPLFTGYRSNIFGQKFTWQASRQLAFNAGLEYNHKKTDRPDTNADISGGLDYEMRYKSLRWNVGGIYKFSDRNSLQADFTIDRYRYGKEYDVETSTYKIGDYVQSKSQRMMEGELKAVLGLTSRSTTVFGLDWRQDNLVTSTGNIDNHVYTLAAYAQHEFAIAGALKGSLGARYTYHREFGSHLTPKAALMYSTGKLNFRATYSNGFRAPGMDELYYRYFSVNRGKAQVSFGNKDLSPEKSHYVSLSAEYRTSRFALSVMGYMNFINDMIVKDNIALDDQLRAMLMKEFPEMTEAQAQSMSTYANYVNSDKGEVKGLQVNLHANPIDGLNLNVNYAYTYARSKSGDTWTLLDRSIKNTLTMSAGYSHAWGIYRLNANINCRMQSTTYYTAYNNAPGYGVWNLNTTHTFTLSRWLTIEPSLGIDNIFNKVDNRIDSSKTTYALYSPGRMVVAGLKIKL